MLEHAQIRLRIAETLRPLRVRWARLTEPLRPQLARARSFRHRHAHWLLLVSLVPAVSLIVALAPVLWSRLTYQMDFEWTEGGGLLHAYRFLHGQPLYPAPYKGFMPYPYPPLHPMLIGVLGSVFGINFTVGRAVSLLSVSLAAGLLAREVYRSWEGTKWPWIWSVLAVGLIVAGYPVCGGYYDLIRVDSLAFVLVVCSCVAVQALEADATRFRYALCVLLFTAAVFTKQTAAFFLAWLLVYLFLKQPGRALLLGFLFAGAAGICLAFVQWRTDGNFLHYVFFALKKHQVVEANYRRGWDTLTNFAPYLPLIPIAAFLAAWKSHLTRRALAWVGMLAVAMPAGLMPLAKIGGHINNLLSIVFLVGPAALCLAGSALGAHTRKRRDTGAEMLILAAAVGFYTYERTFSMKTFQVTEAQRVGARKLHEWAKSFGPRTLVPQFPFLAVANGTELEQTQSMPWVDAWWAGQDMSIFGRYVRRNNVDYLLLNGSEMSFMQEFAAKEFTLAAVRPEGYPLTAMDGVPLPRYLLKPRRERQNPRCLFDFERGKLEGWTGDTSTIRSPQRRTGAEYIGVEGRYFLNSFGQGDSSTSSLLSPTFTVDKPTLSLRVGGGDGAGLRVELLVAGAPVLVARGLRADMLAEVVWDVKPYLGSTAQIRVVDQERGSWGHIEVDSICLED